MPEPLEALLEDLASSERERQRRACDEAIARLPDDPELRRALLRLLLNGAPPARFAAAFSLFRVEGPSLRMLPALLESLELEDGDTRWSATHMLATLARWQGEAIEVLLHESRSAKSAVRRRMALYALREVAPERTDTEAAFLAALDDRDPELRRAALSSLAKLVEPGEACLNRALAALDADADPRMRRIAAVVVPGLARAFPQRSDEARSTLTRARADPDAALSRAATAALGRLEA